MDRRRFLQTLFFSSVLAPYLLASEKKHTGLELYLIGDKPHEYLPSILEEMKKFGIIHGRTAACPSPHPQKRALFQALRLKGWAEVSSEKRPDLSLHFHSLGSPARPSFTVIREGRIWDLRTQKLFSLWKQMNSNTAPSETLTAASFQANPFRFHAGKTAVIYKNGRKIESLPLSQNISRSFDSPKGKISLVIEGGEARITGSSCPNKICLSTPPVSLSGERIICAPNHFFLEIKGTPAVDTVIG